MFRRERANPTGESASESAAQPPVWSLLVAAAVCCAIAFAPPLLGASPGVWWFFVPTLIAIVLARDICKRLERRRPHP